MRIAIVGLGNLGCVLVERLLASGFSPDDLRLVSRGSELSRGRSLNLGVGLVPLTEVSSALYTFA
jgi:pyrroline-5-carboxylate reductase